ncbi:ion channel [Gloeophyllum trabeum ATCC 11539]|uniref:Ion channel n=1 Tax=Gloeophyllum trabeum (strain ATCC 11539 / FP-39264 / Madison 617) TaxID=670483 RepID=S7QKP5_GLOTA|nr:ion channel [Gloeophyllum trabeum ATCC 11539]EPQ59962.1 ion channel [Gloeophyllum trabeum ATCC 11539]
MAAQHHWDDTREALLHGERTVAKRVRSVWNGFTEFALRDNVLEVAVGLMIASAFTTVVNSLVSDILLPPLSLLPFMDHKNLPEKFAVLKRGHNATAHYNTLKQAEDDGAVTLAYGLFLEHVLNFVGLGLVLYALANIYAVVSKDSIIKHTVRCIYCRKEISQKAKRCAFCTGWQDGREDRETSAL